MTCGAWLKPRSVETNILPCLAQSTGRVPIGTLAALQCPWEMVGFQISECHQGSQKAWPRLGQGLCSQSRLYLVSWVLPAAASCPWGLGRAGTNCISMYQAEILGCEWEFSAFCLLSLGFRDGGDGRVVYECKVNKAACGCDDLFLLSVMYSSSLLQGSAFNSSCNWQL